MKPWKIVFNILGILPMGLTLSLLTFFIVARIDLGYFPSYDHPDPKQLAAYNYFDPIIFGSFFVWLYALIAWVATTLTYFVFFLVKNEALPLRPFVFSLCSNVISVATIFATGEWYLD